MHAADTDDVQEVLVIGGGPAGLSAALVAARARRKVTLVDGGTPRNDRAPAIHSFATRDGVLPKEFRRIGREQLLSYPTARMRAGRVEALAYEGGLWKARLEDGEMIEAMQVILAAGVVDRLPEIPGVKENWGRGVHHCVFCDGYEHRDEPWGILLDDLSMAEHLPLYLGWTRDLTVFTHGGELAAEAQERLESLGMTVEKSPLTHVEASGDGRTLFGAMLEDGRRIGVKSLWIRPAQSQTPLVKRLGLRLEENGAVARNEWGESERPGLYVAGDLCAGPAQQAILAAADGAKAAFAVVRKLIVPSV